MIGVAMLYDQDLPVSFKGSGKNDLSVKRRHDLRTQARLRAQVVAPFDGKVVFAGPFKGYGQILIIQHGDAYHTLLAGMRRVDATLGQLLLAGEPIGVMGSQEAVTRNGFLRSHNANRFTSQ